ncbi:M14 family metallopeptidase [Niallia nealsonii]|uniref:Peptidase M14 n=1 Tax=Niallia nealsonii TaxID=115979 RepID=A0A2N0Z8B8_9BACI|nr:M14 family metallopeptidase [Niallia nealsonii]PKG25724.1 peptidase M14 [Niallia nealsonii]
MEVKIRPGDALWYYSQLFRIPLNLIIDSNPNINPDALTAGQSIIIPGFTMQTIQVKQGDSLWKIAGARNISVDSLLLLNQDINPNQLTIGASVKVPKRIITKLVNGKRRYDYATLTRDIEALKAAYPFIKINHIGKSVLNKSIQEIRIGEGSKKVHFNGSFHANEWITTSVLMSYLNEYLLSLTNGTTIKGAKTLPFYQSIDLSIVPMVNPDGVDLVLNGPNESNREEVIGINEGSTDFTGWKANIRGVDLNNQYPANWEIEKERKKPKAPAPRDYPGDAPLTEPEAQAMAELAQKEKFQSVLAFHTQGKEFYWGYEGLEPPESKVLANEFARISGYEAIQYVDSHAGYKDWFIQEFRKPGFTMELGKGINPLPLSQFDEIYRDVLGIFLAALYM